ncbi:transmembrane protein 220-like [Dysidea avara]|uniref:transmembrane protein 220-like n=1 Tax=Dysidea avara TaxID=196820 RepID=UPI0033190C38
MKPKDTVKVTETRQMSWPLLAAGGVFFGLATAAQFNDPDPELWMPIYGVPCVLTSLALIAPTVTESLTWMLVIILDMFSTLLLFVYTMWSGGVSDVTSGLHNEAGRELAGLVILNIWLFILLLHSPWFLSSRWSTLRMFLLTIILSIVGVGIVYYVYVVSEDEKCSPHVI